MFVYSYILVNKRYCEPWFSQLIPEDKNCTFQRVRVHMENKHLDLMKQ